MILVTGSTGQLGTELKNLLGDKAIYLDRVQADFSKPEILRNQIRQYKFDYLINAAAYTQVDKAETERDLAMTVNATSVGVLAEICLDKKAKLVHVSTDYVFSGRSTRPYEVTDPTDPVNFYGETKLCGEVLVREILPSSLIVRTSWVWSEHGKSFFKKICELGESQKEIRVVNDQVGSPTFAADLAFFIISNISALGTYHFSNLGSATWFEFAKAIKNKRNFQAEIVPISTDSLSLAARRPRFSVLKMSNESMVARYNTHWAHRLCEIP